MTKEGHLFYWVANWNLTRAQAALLLRGKIADMVDCTHDHVKAVREEYYSRGVRRFAGYVTGSLDIRWTAEDWASFPEDVSLWRIDQSNQDLPLRAEAKKVVDDQEPGAKTVPQTVEVAKQRLAAGDDLIVYVDQAGLGEVEDAMHNARLPGGLIIAYQYRSTPEADLSVVTVTSDPVSHPAADPYDRAYDNAYNALWKLHQGQDARAAQGLMAGADAMVTRIRRKNA